MKRRRFKHSHDRRGATLVETALALPVLTLLLLASLDVGIFLHYRNLAAWSSAQVAREASRHGATAAPEHDLWGPEAVFWSQSTTEASMVEQTAGERNLRERLTSMAPRLLPPGSEVTVEWLDGDHQIGHRVRVTVAFNYSPFVSLGTTTYCSASYCTTTVKQ